MRAVDNAGLSRSHQNFFTQEIGARKGRTDGHFNQLGFKCGVFALQSGKTFITLSYLSLVSFDHLLFHSIEFTAAFQFSLLRLTACVFCGLLSFKKLACSCRIDITVLSQLIGHGTLFFLAFHVLFQQVSAGFLGFTQFSEQLFLSHPSEFIVFDFRLIFLLAVLLTRFLGALLFCTSGSSSTCATTFM
ncbi:Uncharacterised protein [Klebsiella pneumoniae]|nr:Uncharacterised protein [Klebsiella pneumoniae]